jgi:16S rRNA G966 N2-methylase RsmD
VKGIMTKYLSTFVSGMGDPVSDALRDRFPDLKVRQLFDGLVVYDTLTKQQVIAKLPFVTNSFIVVQQFASTRRDSLEASIDKILKSGDLSRCLHIGSRGVPGTFRVVTSIENELVGVQRSHLEQLEKKIGRELGLIQSRAKAMHEFWVMKRSEGITYFCLRISRVSTQDKARGRGALRPQLAYLLVLLSEPKEQQLFLDPFCGSGSIPLARCELSRTGLIAASDLSAQHVHDFKAQVAVLKLKKRIVVRREDACNLSRYNDEVVHAIVTDPPWGQYEELEDPLQLYSRFMLEFERILRKGGVLVLLVANTEILNQFFETYRGQLKIESAYSILVSGKKARVYKLRKKEI